MKIGLFFGSFNPVHNGHLAIARFLKQQESFEQIWFVVSPQNPFKENRVLADENHRLNMVKTAIRDFPYLQACDAEFLLPAPSYTINTLNYLEKKYPDNEFSLILGADNMKNFYQWKSFEEILNKYTVYVYPRKNVTLENALIPPRIRCVDAPLLPVSATDIRILLQQKKSVAEFLPPAVIEYIEENKIF